MTARAHASTLFVLGVALAACGGGGAPGEVRTIAGTITGLTGSGLVLQLNGGHDLAVPAGATTFQFTTRLTEGSPYVVTVLQHPTSPAQTCTADGEGTVVGDVSDIVVACSTDAFHVGGTVVGLTKPGLVLQLDGEPLAVDPGTTSFRFATPVASGGRYAVAVTVRPTPETCDVENGTGTMGGSDVTGIVVRCVSAATETWAVGAHGTILAWDGKIWRTAVSGTTNDLLGVAYVDASHAWAVGAAGTVLHWNGESWRVEGEGLTANTLHAVWASSSTSVWAVGVEGTILRRNGSAWSRVPSGTSSDLFDVWGSSASNVYAVGANRTTQRWNGQEWASIPKESNSGYYAALWGTGSGNIWAVGDSNVAASRSLVSRWNGSSWTEGGVIHFGAVSDVVGSSRYSDADVWVLSGSFWRYSNDQWTEYPNGSISGSPTALGVASNGNVWAVGTGGNIWRWNGTAWTIFESAISEDLADVAGR